MRMFFECNRILITEHDEGKKTSKIFLSKMSGKMIFWKCKIFYYDFFTEQSNRNLIITCHHT
jgi:hypothetical protein